MVAEELQTCSLAKLVAHITDVHHRHARDAMPRITRLIDAVRNAHAERHPEIVRVSKVFNRVCAHLGPHMRTEEGTLFPAILYMARPDCSCANREALRMSIMIMRHDHAELRDLLRALRWLTSDYAPPDDACASYRSLFRELESFDADLREHIHLESDVLMPRAIAAERTST